MFDYDSMYPEEASFIEAVCANPDDNFLRSVYADWLEEQDDPRSEYLRAEVEHFRKRRSWSEDKDSILWSLAKQVDPLWAALVSRAPFGIMVPGLTFSGTGPKISRADLRGIEERWGEPFPADYAAFLLRHNGGRPSKPYLWSYAD